MSLTVQRKLSQKVFRISQKYSFRNSCTDFVVYFNELSKENSYKNASRKITKVYSSIEEFHVKIIFKFLDKLPWIFYLRNTSSSFHNQNYPTDNFSKNSSSNYSTKTNKKVFQKFLDLFNQDASRNFEFLLSFLELFLKHFIRLVLKPQNATAIISRVPHENFQGKSLKSPEVIWRFLKDFSLVGCYYWNFVQIYVTDYSSWIYPDNF